MPAWIENVPEGQKSGPFRNTRQPQPIEYKHYTATPRSRRANKITLWEHPTGYPTATHSLSAQQDRPLTRHNKHNRAHHNIHGQNTMKTFLKGRNPDPSGTHVNHNRLNTSTIQPHPIPEGQTKSPFGNTRWDTPSNANSEHTTGTLGPTTSSCSKVANRYSQLKF